MVELAVLDLELVEQAGVCGGALFALERVEWAGVLAVSYLLSRPTSVGVWTSVL